MSHIPEGLKYTSSHEWIRADDDGMYTVGITEHAQSMLGEMVYVELPELETEYGAGDEICVVESVKAASDVYAPIAGEVVAVNDMLVDSPDLVNSDPFEEGWLLRLDIQDESELESLLDAAKYKEHLAAEAH